MTSAQNGPPDKGHAASPQICINIVRVEFTKVMNYDQRLSLQLFEKILVDE